MAKRQFRRHSKPSTAEPLLAPKTGVEEGNGSAVASSQERPTSFWENFAPSPDRARWWNWQPIIRHINRKVCGIGRPDWNGGLLYELQRRYPNRKFERAVSVGCGSGGKELQLLKMGLVTHFDLFEVNEVQIEIGKKLYTEAGLADRATWRTDDGVTALYSSSETYDMVFWDNALHRMPDTALAVAGSAKALQSGGSFVMNDYVGPNHYQWSDRELRYGDAVRAGLSERFFRNPRGQSGGALSRKIFRPSSELMVSDDQSQAPDSSRIIQSIKRTFPSPDIWILGGCIYHLCLNDLLANFHPEEDASLLASLLVMDDLLIDSGDYHYAACIAEP